MRHVVLQRLARCGDQAVADDDLFLRGVDAHGRNVGEAFDATRAEKPLFVAEHRAAVVDQPFARTVDEPEIAGLRIDPCDVEAIAQPADDAIVATGDNLRRVDESVRAGNERTRQERFDVARGDYRNGLCLERDHANRRREAHRLASGQR